MPGYQDTVSRTMLLSSSATVFIAVQVLMDVWAYHKARAKLDVLVCLLVLGVATGALPWAVVQGARRSSSHWMKCFTGLSYCAGCIDVLFVCIWTFVASVLYAMHELVVECRSFSDKDVCPKRLADRLARWCFAFDEEFGNVTAAQRNAQAQWAWDTSVTSWANRSDFMEYELDSAECLGVMERLGTVGLLFIVVSLLLRCCAAGCHCMSGVYGVELYTLLEEGHYGDSDLSDLDDDDVSSDSSDNDSPCNSLPIIDEITPLHDQVQH